MACQTTVVSCQTKITKWSVRLFVRTKWPVRLQLSDQNGLSDILSDQNCLTLTHYCQTKIGSILYDTNKTIVAKRCRLFTIQTAFASQPKNSSRGNNHKTTLLTVADQPLSRTWNIPCLELKECWLKRCCEGGVSRGDDVRVKFTLYNAFMFLFH